MKAMYKVWLRLSVTSMMKTGEYVSVSTLKAGVEFFANIMHRVSDKD